jgi:hypothetical protein
VNGEHDLARAEGVDDFGKAGDLLHGDLGEEGHQHGDAVQHGLQWQQQQQQCQLEMPCMLHKRAAPAW